MFSAPIQTVPGVPGRVPREGANRPPGESPAVSKFTNQPRENHANKERIMLETDAAKAARSLIGCHDDDFVRRYAVRCLEDLGYEVVAAENGAAALEQLEGPGRFNVVFSDVLMPGCLSGYGLAAHVGEEHGSAVAILPASGCLASERGEIEVGRFEILSKPDTCEQLGRRLRALLDQRR